MRAQFETNVFGWIELTGLVLPVMRKQGYGRIIMNSSVLGYTAMPYRGAHKKQYESMLLRLNREGAAITFTLGPEAVLKKVIHVLASTRPCIRYYVTVPNYLFAYLKRFLPYRVRGMILMRAGGGGKH